MTGVFVARASKPKNWWGARRLLPSDAPSSRQPACKPGSVRRRLAPARDGHSSGTPGARRLEQPTPGADPDIDPEDCSSAPPLFGLAPGGVCRAAPVAGRAVRSYRTVSPLPAVPKRTGRSLLCGTFPGVTPAGHYPAPYVHGARTFLPGGLSALAGTAVRPTDGLGMGCAPPGVKGSTDLLTPHRPPQTPVSPRRFPGT